MYHNVFNSIQTKEYIFSPRVVNHLTIFCIDRLAIKSPLLESKVRNLLVPWPFVAFGRPNSRQLDRGPSSNFLFQRQFGYEFTRWCEYADVTLN